MRRASPLMFGVLFVGLLVAGCSGGADDATTSSGPTSTAAPTSTTATTAATTTTAAVAADAGCVECHTDQATLQAMAMEPVATETLSEGEG